MSAAPRHAEGDAPVQVPVDAARLTEEQASKVKRFALATLGLGLLGSAAGAAVDSHRFAFSWLIAVTWLVAIGLGALMFVLIQLVTRAGWSVAARRPMEWMTMTLPVGFVLFLPVLLMAHSIYHHWMGPEAHQDPLLAGKAVWLNPGAFYGRAVLYFLIWALIARFVWRNSRAQDESGDPAITFKLQKWSAPLILVTGLSLTFASFDWLMSIDPHWYSTIFGVYYFSGAMTAALSVLALVTLLLQTQGLLRRVSTIEHRHDIGKFLFGFTVFWGYIAFSQFFLIWYANIPEETGYMHLRWEEGWRGLSVALMFARFFIPFVLLLSRTGKRSVPVLAGAAIITLIGHWIDMCWLVLPSHDEHMHLSWIDVAAWIAGIGALASVLAYQAARFPLYPLRDPRLAETMKVDNP